MSISMLRRLALAATAWVVLLAIPLAVSADMVGLCTAEGHSTSSSVNFRSDSVWHLKHDDTAGGSGTAPTKMTKANVYAYALGIALPIAGGTAQPGSDGDTAGSVDGVSVATYAILGRRFVVMGSASGAGSPCSGQIEVIIDDINPMLTVLGGGGIIVAIICLVVLVLLARSGGGCFQRVLGAAFGLVGGCGAALAGEQFGLLDPTQILGLLIAIVAGVVGFFLPGLLSGGGGGDAGATDAGAPDAGGGSSSAASWVPDRPTPPSQPAPMTPEDYGNTATDVFTGGASDPGGSAGSPPPDNTPGVDVPGGGVGGGGPM